MYFIKKISSLFESILSYIYINKIILIQRKWKLFFQERKYKLHGPAYIKRELCNNETDFYSFDSIKDIPKNISFHIRIKIILFMVFILKVL